MQTETAKKRPYVTPPKALMMLSVLPGELRNPARRSAGPARHGDRLLLRQAGQTRQKSVGL